MYNKSHIQLDNKGLMMPKVVFLLCFLLFLFSGCIEPQIVRPIEDVQVTRVSKRAMSEIICSGALRLGWVAKESAPHVIRCTLSLHGHVVVVDVPYTENTFSIRYVSSENMGYDEKTQTIHRKYVQWIRNLRKQILTEAAR